MPAINVARTDTFELQRQKINNIATQIFNITAGGSDLATGNLKIGDGSKQSPSLAFENDPYLGVYRANVGVMGFVAADKKILNLSSADLTAFQDINLQKNTVSEIIISNAGQNYDAGIYNDVFVSGGTGSGLSLNIDILSHQGVINNDGEGYDPGSYDNILIVNGNGTGAFVNFTVPELEGSIINAGSAYAPGNYNPTFVSSTGSGSGASANITISGEVDYSGSITDPGTGYTEGENLAVSLFNNPVTTYTLTAITNPGTPPPAEVFAINGVAQQTLTLTKGNTYRFDISDSSLSTHPLIFENSDDSPVDGLLFVTAQNGAAGISGSFIDLIIKPDAPDGDIAYDCATHNGMGAVITVVSGSAGSFGSGIQADITVNATGVVSAITIGTSGNDYTVNNILTAPTLGLSGGSGFEYTLGSSFVYTGTVASVTIDTQGSGYEAGDLLTFNDADIGGGGGSGFSYEVTSNPGSITDLFWQERGSGYQVGDLLELAGSVNGVSAVLSGTVSDVSGSCLAASTTLTVDDSSGIVAGMSIIGVAEIPADATVVSIPNGTSVVISANPTGDNATATFTFSGPGLGNQIVLSSATGIFAGMIITVASGSGTLLPNTSVNSITESGGNFTIELSQDAESPGAVNLNFTTPYGTTQTQDFEYEVEGVGVIDTIEVNSEGNGYEITDEITVDATLLSQPTSYVVTNEALSRIEFVNPPASGTFTVGESITADGTILFEVKFVKESGGLTSYILTQSNTVSAGEDIETETGGVAYTTQNNSTTYRYFIDGSIEPNITLYVDSQYTFDLSDSSNDGHQFALSEFKDGPYAPSLAENVITNLTSGSAEITVSPSEAALILPNMAVTQNSGSGIPNGTTVVSVDVGTNVVTLSNASLIDATSADLTFAGVEYIDGVSRASDALNIIVRDSTPTLYYYCASGTGHENEGGYDNEEVAITIDANNPKVFGSNALFVVSDINSQNSIAMDIVDGSITLSDVISTNATIATLIATDITAESGSFTTQVATPLLNREGSNFQLKANTFNLTSDLNVDNKLTISKSAGNLETSGYIKVNDYLLVDNILKIEENTISTITPQNIIIQPSVGKLAVVDATSALVLPSGSTLQRPGAAVAVNGSVRYNNQTEQYEGYNANSLSWSSLGGVRDLDGNTYILAELTTGSNDNTLWFINDNVNTFKFTPSYMEFTNVKKARSLSVSAPTFTEWRANIPVVLGQFVKYKNNLYEVTVGGTTGTTGSEPVHTTGAVVNGSAELTWSQIAVAPITFEDYQEMLFDPFGSSPVRVNNNLKFQNATISTTVDDLILAPNSGKKIICDASTTIALPVGADADRGVPIQGSVRFSTTSSQFEGYDGANWGSLGGVKDVDQNTYIIPETSPGANENTLFFYNDGVKSVELSTGALDFYAVDTIRSVTSDELEITTSLLTIDQGATTIDNTSATTTFLHSSKQYLDIGLSAGITVDPILRLDDQGDVYFNTTFGGGFNGVKIFDGQLKEFELSDTRILSDEFVLIKGSVDNGGTDIYTTTIEEGAKVVVTAFNPTTNDKEFIEFGVIDNGSDAYYTEYGNVITGTKLITPTFEYTANNTIRLNILVGDSVGSTQNVNITVVSHITKK